MLAISFLRGTTEQNNSYIGVDGSLTVDIEAYTLRLHDGMTAGGYTFLNANSLGGLALADTASDVPYNKTDSGLDSEDVQAAITELATTRREILESDRTYYVRVNGNDANDGLANTVGGAFATIQKALNTVASLDIGIYNVRIELADGTYTSGMRVSGPWVGSGMVSVIGNISTPENVIVHTPGNCVEVTTGASLTLNGMELRAPVSGNGIAAQMASTVIVGDAMIFGPCAFRQIDVRTGALVQASSYRITGGALSHVICVEGGHYASNTGTITLQGTPAWGVAGFKADSTGTFSIYQVTFSGSATGKRYDVTQNGVINTFGGGASFLPGNSNGTATTGGIYA